ncbi:ABC transporter permease [Catenuloplanes indicus]|uniref:ABC-2 type transport system permease protein n=1 Tax=Catenuloplanes indicus TaxID=137267 RepID=A0AAE3VVC3_9ACTN|nr:ABC-2 family transporter protein [Catenuloplanes indicus]MDQ0364933.1 ABC-2 type transport system permease protein [Catenuloplanes indicus]
MSAYAAVTRTAVRAILTYRLNFVLGFFGSVVQLLAMYAVWQALLAGRAEVGGLTWPQMKAYLMVVFLTGSLVSVVSDFEMADRIRDGMVALDLTKPLSYQAARFAETVGAAGLELCTAAVICLGYGMLAGPMAMPGGGMLALFAVSLLAVVPVKFLFSYLGSLACFWTQNYFGVLWARQTLVLLFSGALVPLGLMPSLLRDVAEVLPFVGVAATPARIFAGDVAGPAAVVLVLQQVLWGVALWLLARAAWRGALRRLTVHGG